MIIESINNEKVKYWRKIRTNKYINEYGEYIVEGEHLVEEAIKSGKAKYFGEIPTAEHQKHGVHNCTERD